MGLILDASVLITAERNAESAKELLARVVGLAGNHVGCAGGTCAWYLSGEDA